jgi:hypothetical protein
MAKANNVMLYVRQHLSFNAETIFIQIRDTVGREGTACRKEQGLVGSGAPI